MRDVVKASGGAKVARIGAALAAVMMLSGLAVVALAPAADAHGAATRPGSRTYLCRVDGLHASSDIQPSNPACGEAVSVSGKQPLWDWFGVLRGDGAGRTRGFIPDGQLCSGGETKYAGYDLARNDWPYTRLTSGASMTVRYNAWAAHPGQIRLYVTRDGYDPTVPLRWDDLEAEPFSVYEQNQPNGTDEANNSPDYQWTVNLPNKSGPHVIYSVWERSDSQETFYGCSDVRFDGGSGEVVGVGPGAVVVGAPSGQPAAAAADAGGAADAAIPPAGSGAEAEAAPAAAPTDNPAMADGADAGYDPAAAPAGGRATPPAAGSANPVDPASGQVVAPDAAPTQAGASAGLASATAQTTPADPADPTNAASTADAGDAAAPLAAPIGSAGDAAVTVGAPAGRSADGSTGQTLGGSTAVDSSESGGGIGWLLAIAFGVIGVAFGAVATVAIQNHRRAQEAEDRLESLLRPEPGPPATLRPIGGSVATVTHDRLTDPAPTHPVLT